MCSGRQPAALAGSTSSDQLEAGNSHRLPALLLLLLHLRYNGTAAGSLSSSSFTSLLPSTVLISHKAGMIPRRLLVRPAACRSHLSVYSAPRPVHVLHHRPSRSFHHRYSLLAAEASVPSANASTAASSPSQLGSVRSQPHSSSSSSFDVLGIAFFLGLSGLTLYLGTWQLQRKQWKERLDAEQAASRTYTNCTTQPPAHFAICCDMELLQTGARTDGSAQGRGHRHQSPATRTVITTHTTHGLSHCPPHLYHLRRLTLPVMAALYVWLVAVATTGTPYPSFNV